jgi:hypothetical protein
LERSIVEVSTLLWNREESNLKEGRFGIKYPPVPDRPRLRFLAVRVEFRHHRKKRLFHANASSIAFCRVSSFATNFLSSRALYSKLDTIIFVSYSESKGISTAKLLIVMPTLLNNSRSNSDISRLLRRRHIVHILQCRLLGVEPVKENIIFLFVFAALVQRFFRVLAANHPGVNQAVTVKFADNTPIRLFHATLHEKFSFSRFLPVFRVRWRRAALSLPGPAYAQRVRIPARKTRFFFLKPLIPPLFSRRFETYPPGFIQLAAVRSLSRFGFTAVSGRFRYVIHRFAGRRNLLRFAGEIMSGFRRPPTGGFGKGPPSHRQGD